MKKTPESVLIVADIEGTVGIYDKKQCKQDSSHWKHTRKVVTKDINAAVSGILQAGVKKITIKDMHATGFNILPKYIKGKVECMQGHHWMPIPMFGKIPMADIAVMTGFHSAPDQPDGFSPHIFHKRIRQVKIDGRPMTEVELFAALLGEYQIPVAFVTADKLALERIKNNMPWVSSVEVPKHKMTEEQEEHIREEITSELCHTIKTCQNIKPFCLGQHVVEVVTYDKTIRWEETSAVETLRKVMTIAIFNTVPEYLISYTMTLYRFWFRLKEIGLLAR